MKAVLFDLYETLITEWSGEKYTSAECAADLGVSTPVFREHWEALHDAMNTGALTYKQALCRIGMSAGVPLSEEVLAKVYARRLATKSACFAHIDPSVSAMLEALKRAGYRLGLCSNCSAEEVAALDSSILRPYFDAVVLSYEVGMAKPDPRIFLRTAEGLAVAPEDCIFIGDGGSRELYGALEAGMTPLRAMWFLDGHQPSSMPFEEVGRPEEVPERCESK